MIQFRCKEGVPSKIITVSAEQIASYYSVGEMTSNEATRIHLKNGQHFDVTDTPEQVAWLLEATTDGVPERGFPTGENKFRTRLRTALAGLAPMEDK